VRKRQAAATMVKILKDNNDDYKRLMQQETLKGRLNKKNGTAIN